MLQVVGEASPQHFHLHFLQAPYMELPQTQFALDPGVTKLHDSSPTTILFAGFFASHLLAKRNYHRTFCTVHVSHILCSKRAIVTLDRHQLDPILLVDGDSRYSVYRRHKFSYFDQLSITAAAVCLFWGFARLGTAGDNAMLVPVAIGLPLLFISASKKPLRHPLHKFS